MKCGENNEWVLSKKFEAIEWENQTNECEHFCDNNSGYQTKLICSTSDGSVGICEDDKCTVKEKTLKNMTRVEIEFEGDSMTEADLDKARESR